MKYKKGSIVEVLVRENFYHHSWRCAQIVSNTGHNYTVSYNVYPGFTNKSDMSQISSKSIRPCPPLLENSQCFVPGDVVEVFLNLSWKMAIVLKAFNFDQFLVRLFGPSQEFEVTKSEIRVRQSFQNGEWVIINKVYGDGVGENSVMSSSGSCSINNSCKPGYGMCCGTGVRIGDGDAESVCEMRCEDEEEESDDDDDDEGVSLVDEIHRLELHAYRCTMEALHALGPLTWEKETMVTNLRMLLHISNDEHLAQIKNLISGSSNR